MHSALNRSPLSLVSPLLVSAVGAIVVLFALKLLTVSVTVPAPAQVLEARSAGSKSLLRQAALHMSKMQTGNSVGGFPGFEPPDDDEKYLQKIKTRSYSAQDVNDWVREINNFLNQIARKNPGMSLEEILTRQGLTQAQVNDYVEALRTAYRIASEMQKDGVKPVTVHTLRSVLLNVGVIP